MTLKVHDKLLEHDVGVIVGRFQVHKLHSEHIDLIRTVCERHLRTIIFLGNSPARTTKRNPLDYQLRRKMIEDAFPDLKDVYYVFDHPDDHEWSKNLDQLINHHIGDKSAVLYGSRDSFISHYHGRYQTCELLPNRIVSGSELRRVVGNQSRGTEDFRAGVIWAVEQQYSHAWNTVDVAILNEDNTKILLGHKKTDPEGTVRFIGGFVRTKLARIGVLEANVKAETYEETGAEVSNPQYIGSAIINDWRYRGEENEVMTTLFAVKYLFGPLKAADDIDSIQWCDIDALTDNAIVESHRPLLQLLRDWRAAGNRV